MLLSRQETHRLLLHRRVISKVDGFLTSFFVLSPIKAIGPKIEVGLNLTTFSIFYSLNYYPMEVDLSLTTFSGVFFHKLPTM